MEAGKKGEEGRRGGGKEGRMGRGRRESMRGGGWQSSKPYMSTLEMSRFLFQSIPDTGRGRFSPDPPYENQQFNIISKNKQSICALCVKMIH